MSNMLPPTAGDTTALPASAGAAVMPGDQLQDKAIDLAILKKGAKDFLTFVDDTKELFYAYLYHRVGSKALAATLMSEIYLETISRAMSLWWFGSLSMQLLLDAADKAIAAGLKEQAADLDDLYVPSLTWLSADERKSVSSLHESLWTLPQSDQRLLTLSLLSGLSDDRVARMLGQRPDSTKAALEKAKAALVEAWRPCESLKGKLSSLVFEPALDLTMETALRMTVVEKYNALRLRRYQWVIAGGLLAVFSNLVVAGVIGFAVISMPQTSLRSMKQEVASLDAVLLKRKLESLEMRKSVANTVRLSRGMTAAGAVSELNDIGRSTAAETMAAQRNSEREVDTLIDLLKRASTAMRPASVKIAGLVRGIL